MSRLLVLIILKKLYESLKICFENSMLARAIKSIVVNLNIVNLFLPKSFDFISNRLFA